MLAFLLILMGFTCGTASVVHGYIFLESVITREVFRFALEKWKVSQSLHSRVLTFLGLNGYIWLKLMLSYSDSCRYHFETLQIASDPQPNIFINRLVIELLGISIGIYKHKHKHIPLHALVHFMPIGLWP